MKSALLQVENEEKTQLPSRQGSSPEQASAIEESIFKLSGQLSSISRSQKYFRTRENRNFSTVRSTERRIFRFSVIEGMMMVAMAGLQVFIVRFFFQGARKGELWIFISALAALSPFYTTTALLPSLRKQWPKKTPPSASLCQSSRVGLTEYAGYV